MRRQSQRFLTRGVLALGLLISVPASAAAEWYIKPFLGLTFGGGTTLVADLEYSKQPDVSRRKLVYGASVSLLGNVFGIEADVSHVPGFFECCDESLVRESSATTLMGSVLVALPRSVAAYSLRPYFVAGMGLMRLYSDDFLETFPLADNRLAVNIGGGATGFLSEHFGVSWDVRHFRRVPGNDVASQDIEPAKLSFWRATMAAAFRY